MNYQYFLILHICHTAWTSCFRKNFELFSLLIFQIDSVWKKKVLLLRWSLLSYVPFAYKMHNKQVAISQLGKKKCWSKRYYWIARAIVAWQIGGRVAWKLGEGLKPNIFSFLLSLWGLNYLYCRPRRQDLNNPNLKQLYLLFNLLCVLNYDIRRLIRIPLL